MTTTLATRGTSNGNQRGSAANRRARRAWIVLNYASNVIGHCRCYRCGVLLYNPDRPPLFIDSAPADSLGSGYIQVKGTVYLVRPLTVDRIVPGCQGGTYRRNNIRPACGPCNSETGGSTRSIK